MIPLRSLGLAGQIAVVVVAVILVAVAVWWAGGGARRDAAAARSEAALAGSRAASGAQATETIAAGAQRDAASDNLTMENSRAIDQAPGAGQRIDDGVGRAGLVSLCRRPSARGRPECVQLLGPIDVSSAGSKR